VDIAAVLDADRSDARIRSGGNADRISGGVTGISGGGRETAMSPLFATLIGLRPTANLP
jgi:hypothetical protein